MNSGTEISPAHPGWATIGMVTFIFLPQMIIFIWASIGRSALKIFEITAFMLDALFVFNFTREIRDEDLIYELLKDLMKVSDEDDGFVKWLTSVIETFMILNIFYFIVAGIEMWIDSTTSE